MRKFTLLFILLVTWTFAAIYTWNVYVMPPKAVAYTVEVAAKVDSAALIERVRPELDPGIRAIIAAAVDKYTTLYSLDPALVAAIMLRESEFSSTARSDKGAVGVMQIMASAHPEKCKGLKRNELYYIDNNVRIGCQILAEYLKSSATVKEALRRYSGQHPTYSSEVLVQYGEMTIKRG